MRILVAGGAGFIGSHLSRKLLQEGHHVICVDNFSSGQYINLMDLESHNRFTLIEQDICVPLDEEVDQIYNLACPASPVHYQADPIRTFYTNVFGTHELIQLALRNNATLLQASTSEVYGDPLQHPQTEEYWGNVNPIGQRACYDEGKRAAETMLTDFHYRKGLDVRIARIFNTFGPGMRIDDGRVVSNFIMQALRGDDITIYGNGGQTRSFCYVDDLVCGLIRLMSQKGLFAPINLGNPDEYTVQHLAEMIIRKTKSKSNVDYGRLPQDDPKRRQPDISKAIANLGWAPKITLEKGLDLTIPYFQMHV